MIMNRLLLLAACAVSLNGIAAFTLPNRHSSPIHQRTTTTTSSTADDPLKKHHHHQEVVISSNYCRQRRILTIHSSNTQEFESSIQSNNSNNDEAAATTRKELINLANVLYPTTISNNNDNDTSNNEWSNRYGKVITPASVPGVYTCDVPFYWNKIDVGGRMTIIQLSTKDGNSNKPDLFIHSPVGLNPSLLEALDQLGTVKHVVSPNYEHVKYAKEWADTFPDAYIWGCPGLAEREPHVRWTGEIGYKTRPSGYIDQYELGDAKQIVNADERMWDWSEIQPLHMDVEVNPFTGKPFFNEVVFFHTKSKTLLTTDLFWNYPGDGITNSNYDDLKEKNGEDFGVWELAPIVDRVPFGSRAWKFGMDKVYLPFYLKLMIKSDKRDEFEQLTKFLSGLDRSSSSPWDIQTIIPCHGDIIRGSTFTKQVLKDHFKL